MKKQFLLIIMIAVMLSSSCQSSESGKKASEEGTSASEQESLAETQSKSQTKQQTESHTHSQTKSQTEISNTQTNSPAETQNKQQTNSPTAATQNAAQNDTLNDTKNEQNITPPTEAQKEPQTDFPTKPQTEAPSKSQTKPQTEAPTKPQTKPQTATPTKPQTIPPVEPAKGFPYKFTATDIFGNSVTEKSLGEKQIYFVHLWATWCGPCVREMPDLAKLVKDYGDRVGFLGLVGDYDSNLKGAVNVIETNNIPSSFIMINASESTAKAINNLVKSGYFPTTVILDSKGNILGKQLVGALGNEYETHLEKYLD